MKRRLTLLTVCLALSYGITAGESSKDIFQTFLATTGAKPTACTSVAEQRIAYRAQLVQMFAQQGWGNTARYTWQFCGLTTDTFQTWLAKWQKASNSQQYKSIALRKYTRDPWQYWLYCLSCRAQSYTVRDGKTNAEIWVEFYNFRQSDDDYRSSNPAPGGLIRIGRLR
jgi:hypothetical protein